MLGRVVLEVLAHEEPLAEVVPQYPGFHELAQGTAKAHRCLDSFGYGFPHLTPWNVGSSGGRHGQVLCSVSGVGVCSAMGTLHMAAQE